jgi:hypothetical protein
LGTPSGALPNPDEVRLGVRRETEEIGRRLHGGAAVARPMSVRLLFL